MSNLAKKIAIDKNNLCNNFFNRTNIRSARQKVATLIQLEYIAFQIECSTKIALYDENLNSLKEININELIEPYIFPAVSSSYDNKQIADYFDHIFRRDVVIFNRLKIENAKPFDSYGYVRGIEKSQEIKKEIEMRIRKKIEKQKELRKFYNVC